MSALDAWDSFYVIVGSSAGALIGLQFVVMTLIAERPQAGASLAGRAFGTPTVVHFSACLMLAALVRIPWPEAANALWAAGAAGAAGLIYTAITAARMWRQDVYRPDFEDVLCHVVLPLAAYGLLVAAGAWGRAHLEPALYAVGAAALILLFDGIHNAWDAVAYHVYVQRRPKP